MVQLRKFWSLTSREKCFFAEAVVLLLCTALCVRIIAFKRLYVFLNERFDSVLPRSCETADVKAVDRSISQAANMLAWKNVCLIRSMALFIMLRRRGFPVVLLAGVKVLEDSTLGAHAWVDPGHSVTERLLPNNDYAVILKIGSSVI
jgi:hypothetical protein